MNENQQKNLDEIIEDILFFLLYSFVLNFLIILHLILTIYVDPTIDSKSPSLFLLMLANFYLAIRVIATQTRRHKHQPVTQQDGE